MKWLKRIGKVVLVLVLALLAFAGGSILIEGALGSGRVDGLTNTRIPNPGGPAVRAYVARPSTPGPHPAVIMVHEFWGLKQDIVGKAEALAKEGYVVVAPDLMRGSSTSSLVRAIFQVASTPMPQIDGDLDAVFTWLTTQPDVKPDRIAVMGFCFGGGASLRYSVNTGKPAATIVFYGTPISDAARLKNISGPVLGIFGGDDGSIPVASVQAMEAGLKDAGVKNEISIYPEQPHAFVTSIEEINQGGPQQQAWNQLLAFLKQSLQASAPPRHTAVVAGASDGVDWGYIARLAWSHAIETHQH